MRNSLNNHSLPVSHRCVGAEPMRAAVSKHAMKRLLRWRRERPGDGGHHPHLQGHFAFAGGEMPHIRAAGSSPFPPFSHC